MELRPGTSPVDGSVTRRPSTEMSGAEDADLVGCLADGGETALGAVYDRFAPHVYALALHLCRVEAVAEQVTEDVFVALRRRPDLLASLSGPLTARMLVLTYRRAVGDVADLTGG